MWCSQRKFVFFTWEITIFHRNVAFEVGDNRPSCCGRCGRSCPGHQGSRPRIWSKRRIDRSKGQRCATEELSNMSSVTEGPGVAKCNGAAEHLLLGKIQEITPNI